MSECKSVNERYGEISQNDDRSLLQKLLTRNEKREQNVNCEIGTAEQKTNNVKLGCGDCSTCKKVEAPKAKRVNLSLNREEQGHCNKKCKLSDETEKIKIISVIDVVNGKELGDDSKVTVSDNVLGAENPKECPDLSGPNHEFRTPITEKHQLPSMLPEQCDIGVRKSVSLHNSTILSQTTLDICNEYSQISVSQSSSRFIDQESQDTGVLDRPFVNSEEEVQNTSTHDMGGCRMLMSYLARKDFLERQKLMFLAVRENIEKQRKHFMEYYDSEIEGIDRQLVAVNAELLQVYKQV